MLDGIFTPPDFARNHVDDIITNLNESIAGLEFSKLEDGNIRIESGTHKQWDYQQIMDTVTSELQKHALNPKMLEKVEQIFNSR